MFGYVVADQSKMTEDQQRRYQGCYCGLCRAIGRDYGGLSRLALNYDMTFLILLLSSLYEPAESETDCRCAVHPLKAHRDWQTEVTYYAAAMNMTLAYHNCMDDWHDDKSLSSLAQAAVFRGHIREIASSYPRQWDAILSCLEALREIESRNLQDPDRGANAFGRLLGELFVWREDRWAPCLRQLGQALGRFIYLMDAVLDLPRDQKWGQYNPLKALADGRSREEFRPMLTMHIGEAADAFEQLPLLQDLDLLRNILYSGVWTRFAPAERKSHKEANNV